MEVPGNGNLLARLDERYDNIQTSLKEIKEMLGSHSRRIGNLEVEQGKVQTRQSIWAGLNSLGVMIAAALGINK